MLVQVTFSNLLGLVTTSHTYGPASSPRSGTARVVTTVPTFVTASGGTTASAEAALAAGLSAGKAYLNIHTNVLPGGENRGFFVTQAVPEPATSVLLVFGLIGLSGVRRFRK